MTLLLIKEHVPATVGDAAMGAIKALGEAIAGYEAARQKFERARGKASKSALAELYDELARGRDHAPKGALTKLQIKE